MWLRYKRWLQQWKSQWWPSRSAIREIWQLLLFSRIALVLVGWIGLARFPWKYYSPQFNVTANPLVLMWIRWDAMWYTRIALQGYWTQALAFFPLYPLLIAGVHWVTFTALSVYSASLVVSNLGLIAFAVTFYALVNEYFDDTLARRSLWMAIMFPTAFFLSAAYTESIFLFLSTAVFLLAKRRRYWAAGLLGLLAAITRNEGVFTAIPILWAYYQDYGLRFHKRILSVLGIPLGIAAFMAYQWAAFGNPLTFIQAESYWGRHITWPWVGGFLAIQEIFRGGPLQANTVLSMIDLVSAMGFVALWLYGWRKHFPLDWLIYWGVLLLVDVSAPDIGGRSPLLSMSRLVLILFPGFVALGILSENDTWRRFLQWTLPGLQMVFFLLFVTWRWIA